MERIAEKIKIDSFTLKMIAMLSMLADHIGAVLFPEQILFRVIGRLAFPIFAYTLVEGFFYTHDIQKYMCRIGILALVSEIPFDLTASGKILEFGHQNIFFTLFIGLVMMYFLMKSSGKFEMVTVSLVSFLIADLLRTDYGGIGVLMILCFYLFRDDMLWKTISILFVNIALMGGVQVFGVLALIPIYLYNGTQGKKMEWLFYGFYPVHLLALFLIKMILS